MQFGRMAQGPAHPHTPPNHHIRAPLNGAADAAAPSTMFQNGGKQQEHKKSEVKKIQSTRENKSCWAGGEQRRLEELAARPMSLFSLLGLRSRRVWDYLEMMRACQSHLERGAGRRTSRPGHQGHAGTRPGRPPPLVRSSWEKQSSCAAS